MRRALSKHQGTFCLLWGLLWGLSLWMGCDCQRSVTLSTDLPCLSDPDCRLGLQCEQGRCMPYAGAKEQEPSDGGVSDVSAETTGDADLPEEADQEQPFELDCPVDAGERCLCRPALTRLFAHPAGFVSLALAQKQGPLVSLDQRGALHLWDAERSLLSFAMQIAYFQAGATLPILAVQPQGALLAFSTTKGVGLWPLPPANTTAQGIVYTSAHTAELQQLVFSSDGRWLLARTAARELVLWQLSHPPPPAPPRLTRSALVKQAHQAPLTALAADPKQPYFASGGEGGEVRLWSLSAQGTLQMRAQTKRNAKVLALAFHPQQELLLVLWSDRKLQLLGPSLRSLGTFTSDAQRILFFPAGLFFASLADVTLSLWRVQQKADQSWQLVRASSYATRTRLLSLAFDARKRRVYASNALGHILSWQFSSSGVLGRVEVLRTSATDYALHPKQPIAAIGTTHNGLLSLFSLRDGRLLHRLRAHPTLYFTGLSFGEDGLTLVSVDTESLRFWSMKTEPSGGFTLSAQKALTHHKPRFPFCQPLHIPTRRWLAFLGQDQSVLLLDLHPEPGGAPKGSLLKKFSSAGTELTTLAGESKGRWLATGTRKGDILLWDIRPDARGLPRGKLIRTLRSHTRSITSLAFSQDGSRLLSGSQDQTIQMWDISPDPLGAPLGQNIRTFRPPTAYPIIGLAFHPRGAWFASITRARTSSNSLLHLWSSQDGTILQTLTGNFTAINQIAFRPTSPPTLVYFAPNAFRVWTCRP